MTKPIFKRPPPRTLTVASIALAFVLTGVAQSSAECGGYCEARQARSICHHAVASRDLKAHERDAEFEKCKSDPLSYLRPSVRVGSQLRLE
jgi:hypothetical protein